MLEYFGGLALAYNKLASMIIFQIMFYFVQNKKYTKKHIYVIMDCPQ